MSAVLRPAALSKEPRRVTPIERVPMTTERFSRSLDQRNPHCRSSTARIVPMDNQPSSHLAERIGAVIGGIAIVVFLIAEKAGVL